MNTAATKVLFASHGLRILCDKNLNRGKTTILQQCQQIQLSTASSLWSFNFNATILSVCMSKTTIHDIKISCWLALHLYFLICTYFFIGITYIQVRVERMPAHPKLDTGKTTHVPGPKNWSQFWQNARSSQVQRMKVRAPPAQASQRWVRG